MALGICFILEISRISDFEDLEDFEDPRQNLKIEQNLAQSELYFRVVFRGWECSHSIRSEILLRNICPGFFQLFQKYFPKTI